MNFWSIFLFGTSIFLLLAAGFIASILQHERVKNRLQKEKLALAEAAEKRYSSLFNGVTDIIYEHSYPDGVVLQINRAVAQILGYPTTGVLGHTLNTFLTGGQTIVFEKYLAGLTTPGSEVTGLLPIRNQVSGEVILLEYRSTAVVKDGGIFAISGIARDVTRQKRADLAVIKSQKRVEKLLHEAEIAKNNLAEVSRQLINIQEEERRRISRELHDEVSQLIVAVKIDLTITRKLLAQENETVLQKMADMEALLTQIMDQIHRFLRELRPRVLDELGLFPALRQIVGSFGERIGIKIQMETGDEEDESVIERLTAEQKTVLFRVVQESLTNIAKHANAQSVNIYIARDEDGVICEIADDGRGLQISQDKSPSGIAKSGFGVMGMRERVRLVSGVFTIGPNRTKGTRVFVRIPIQTEHGEAS